MNKALSIGIIGHGKMGHMVEAIARERGHSIGFISNSSTSEWGKADVCIDFTRPDSALDNIKRALDMGLPMVIGTTGWMDALDNVSKTIKAQDGALLYASNFSLGVNIMFSLNERLGQLTQGTNYTASIEEIHHTEKLDSPSGTAISLAEGIISNTERYTGWSISEPSSDELPILPKRVKGVPGTHTVRWENDIDSLELKHEAKNRRGFALGAIIAAEWLHGRKGLYTMQDVLRRT